ITARVRMGSGKLVDIEREVELGGPLHSKGVMILSGYLTASFAPDAPFSLHASLVFEQSYGGIDGDSASSAELYALLSALAEVPIRQGYAVTGSVNQFGEVQAIGGVNEKIEGFFATCKARGLTGDQAVLIPRSNVEHLCLRHEVVDAVRQGQFGVITVGTIAEGIEILTGVTAGERGTDGTYPEGTINARVEARLRAFAETRKAFVRKPGTDDEALA
ncbi:MAG: peptidase, partial [Rhodobacteraceae bacterium]|nr:peptidase [Paracoccaceae bacterium]